MIEEFKRNVSTEKFLQDGMNYQESNRSDNISYIEFIKYFAEIETITEHNIIIGINFTYGWMPTIFEFCSDKFYEAIVILNDARNGCVPGTEKLLTLKGLFNNSMVGTSKLLHFINPSVFAIWDSRVYRYLTKKEPHDYRIGNAEAYLSYIDFCKFLTNDYRYEEVHQSIIRKVGYQMTEFRTAELIMYTSGAK